MGWGPLGASVVVLYARGMWPALTEETLREVALRYHPRGHLDIEPGYAALPEVQARRAAQTRAASDTAAWRALADDVRQLWPAAQLLDHTTLHLDTSRHLRTVREHARPERQLVALTSILGPVGLVYESIVRVGREAEVHPPGEAADAEGVRALAQLVERHGWHIVPWPLAHRPLHEVAVGNRLPGTATLADALFSDHRW